MKMLKKEVRGISIDQSLDIDSKKFKKLYRKCFAEPYSLLFIDIAVPSNGPLHF